MRSIKFRVWSKDYGMFIDKHRDYDFFIEGRPFKNLDITQWDKDNSDCICLNNCVIQQFTGITDVKNKEIYEGDLVEFKYAIQPNIKQSCGVYEVFYKENSAAFYLKVIKKNWFDNSFLTKEEAQQCTIDPICPVLPILEQPLSNYKICRVIGNIFHTPHLLKQ